MLQRLRAALTPRAVTLLILMALLSAMYFGKGKEQTNSLETRLERTLSRIEGAGSVSVVISTRQEEGGTTGGMLGTQKGENEIPCGAVVVASGASDPVVRMQIAQALCAVLGLPASCVSVAVGE